MKKVKNRPGRFEKKICLVTGGGSGIGRATCLQMAEEGGIVVVIDENDRDGNKTCSLILSKKQQAVFIHVNVALPEEIKNCLKIVVKKFGRVDVLVNNAAMMTFAPITKLTIADWDKLMEVNLRSVFIFCKLCLPLMKNAAVVNVSSVHAHESSANVLPYAASKAAMEAFTRGLSIEYKKEKARFNCVAPGAVDTPLLWSNPNIKNGKENIKGVVGKPADLANVICFLASDDAIFVNGATLVADGGILNKL